MRDINRSAFKNRKSRLGDVNDPLMEQLQSWKRAVLPEGPQKGRRKNPFGSVKTQLLDAGGMSPARKVKGVLR